MTRTEELHTKLEIVVIARDGAEETPDATDDADPTWEKMRARQELEAVMKPYEREEN